MLYSKISWIKFRSRSQLESSCKVSGEKIIFCSWDNCYTTPLFKPQKPFKDMQYYALFYSHILCGILGWGSTTKTRLTPIQILQNKVLRIMNKSTWNDCIKEILLGIGFIEEMRTT